MKIYSAFLAAALLAGAVSCKSNTIETPQTPQQAIETMLEGNARYVSQTKLNPNCSLERIAHTAPHQEPFAAVVGCSDSRVPVELLFDCGIGDIFVIRTAGNNVGNDSVLGSVEYAVDHLGVKVLMVLGHESCGGVTSAISGEGHHGAIGNLLHQIQNDIPEFAGQVSRLDDAIRTHTHVQVADLLANPIVAAKVKEGKLSVVAAYYDIDNGLVNILD